MKYVDLMLENSNELHSKLDTFLSRIRANYNLEKITNKLQGFYSLEFDAFLSELKKQKVNLSLNDQDELEEYFKDYKNQLERLKSSVDETNREIDNIVYKIYGLSDKERAIIEASMPSIKNT